MLKVAVVGTGFIGSVHAKNIARHPGAELVAVSDPNIEAAKKIAATTGAKVVADIAEILNNESIQESQRQSFRGVSLYKGQQIFKDGLHPGWFERIEQSYYEAIDAFFWSIMKGPPPSPCLEDGLKA
ncbi:MAG: Gfo/Idh/MocA family oxidoreductase, partial [Verrucomicrobia bacterium]|nr:Gfo/Idh/MocA family oxidoreductase [Verrucomicrobiota bacterium]